MILMQKMCKQLLLWLIIGACQTSSHASHTVRFYNKTLVIREGETTEWRLDVCDISPCSDPSATSKGEIYVGCGNLRSWGDVISNTGNRWPRYFSVCGDYATGKKTGKALRDRLTIIQYTGLKEKAACLSRNQEEPGRGSCNRVIGIRLADPSPMDEGIYFLGTYQTGSDEIGQFNIQVISPGEPDPTPAGPTGGPMVDVRQFKGSGVEDIIEFETNFGQKNWFIHGLVGTVQRMPHLNSTGCVACAMGRPTLTMVPYFIQNETHPEEFGCLIQLLHGDRTGATGNCSWMTDTLPEVKVLKAGPAYVDGGETHHCYCNHKGNHSVGNASNCYSTSHWDNSRDMVHLADLYWYCGRAIVRNILRPGWQGCCALVGFIVPFKAVPMTPDGIQQLVVEGHHRGGDQLGPMGKHLGKRGATGDNPHGVYFDSIGVPRGIPNEFKYRNEIVAGFESVFFIHSVVNKNVAAINYIYYNLQLLTNMTRQAVHGLARQLEATSRMTLQNRMVLDMMEAEKGGVCVYFGDYCCSYIPNNTRPDGEVGRALKSLTDLSVELKKNAGVDNAWGEWFLGMFGGWGQWLSGILTSVAVFLVILVLLCFCGIPLAKVFIAKFISNMLTTDKKAGQMLMRDLQEQVQEELFDTGLNC